jgi:hypothetical protein
MKYLEIIIVLCLIILTYQSCESGTKKEDCKAENLSNSEKEKGAEYCCYAEGVINPVCITLSKYQYNNIKDYIKKMKLIGLFSDDAKIDCKSLYLGISLLSFLLLLL